MNQQNTHSVAYFSLIDGIEENKSFYLHEEETLYLGRNPTCSDIIFGNKSVSGSHCQISYLQGQVYVVDNHSSNGIYLNEEKVEQAIIEVGDTLRLGEILIKFEKVAASVYDGETPGQTELFTGEEIDISLGSSYSEEAIEVTEVTEVTETAAQPQVAADNYSQEEEDDQLLSLVSSEHEETSDFSLENLEIPPVPKEEDPPYHYQLSEENLLGLRTEVSQILRAANLLHQEGLSSVQKKLLEVIFSCGHSVLGNLNELRSAYLSQFKKAQLKPQCFHLRKLVESVLELVAKRIRYRRMDLFYELEEGLPVFIYSDPQALEQVMLNLISDMLQFPESKEIVVAVKEKERSAKEIHLLFIIHPQGKVPQTIQHQHTTTIQLQKLLDPRLLEETDLPLCQKIVETMQGTMWKETQSDQSVAQCFSIWAGLPENLQHDALQESQGALMQLQNKRALLLYQNETGGRILAQQLRKWGMKVSLTSHHNTAWSWVRQQTPFDVAILNMEFASTEEINLAIKIHKLKKLHPLPLLLLPPIGQPESKLYVWNKLFTGFLAKPIKQRELLQRLLKIFSHTRSLQD